jgi:alpha-L-fucosidase
MSEKAREKDIINEKGLDAQEIVAAKRQEAIRKQAEQYVYPTSPLQRETLEWFEDQKFGLMVHWGLYNQMGMKESWPLVDKPWTKWQFKPGTTNLEVKQMYAQLHKGFLPLRFDPDEWAEAAYAAGFRYLCFTTKHHDGFCMWDTATTDYKVTGSEVPYRDNKNADITRVLFDAFRKRGMGISLYYSRGDFSCPYYWEEGYAMKDGTERVPSYDPDQKPEKWKKFQEYTYAQLKELVSDYGRIDALWYDGGCDGVKLGVPEMTEKLREIQPHMLGIMRGGHGVCEDVITPELVFPDGYVDVPWEVCTVMAKPLEEYGESSHTSFGYTYDIDYMSAKEVAHMLLDVVSKGGNLALNLAPQPDGRLPGRALRELAVLAEWMKVFSSAIHGTRAVSPYRTEKFAYTRTKDGKKVHAFYLYDDGECVARAYNVPFEGKASRVSDMRTGRELVFVQNGGILTVQSDNERVGEKGDIADCFVIEV